mmetsp:Transcript_73660/g.193256  ORF Transcript_73660/g.193256 Transcript_73660/m.193256 type:complete len:238 (+) Transcript_73660:204-917(+)
MRLPRAARAALTARRPQLHPRLPHHRSLAAITPEGGLRDLVLLRLRGEPTPLHLPVGRRRCVDRPGRHKELRRKRHGRQRGRRHRLRRARHRGGSARRIRGGTGVLLYISWALLDGGCALRALSGPLQGSLARHLRQQPLLLRPLLPVAGPLLAAPHLLRHLAVLGGRHLLLLLLLALGPLGGVGLGLVECGKAPVRRHRGRGAARRPGCGGQRGPPGRTATLHELHLVARLAVLQN